MENKTILKLLNDENYTELRKLVLQEIAVKEAKNSNTAKAILRLSKLAKKDMQKVRPALAGAYIFDFGKTQITNGFWAYINDNELAGLEMVKEYREQPDLDKVIDKKAGHEIELNREELSNAVAEKKLFTIEDVNFNAEYVQNMAKCFDTTNTIIKLINNGGWGSIMFIAPDSRGIVLSMRKA